MTRLGYELDFGSGNELGEPLTMARGEMMVPLAPQCERGTTNLLVVSRQFRQEALIAAAHPGDEATHIGATKMLPKITEKLSRKLRRPLEKSLFCPSKHDPGKPLDQESIPTMLSKKADLPRSRLVR